MLPCLVGDLHCRRRRSARGLQGHSLCKILGSDSSSPAEGYSLGLIIDTTNPRINPACR